MTRLPLALAALALTSGAAAAQTPTSAPPAANPPGTATPSTPATQAGTRPAQPTTAQPTTAQPATARPTAGTPATGQPAPGQPAAGQAAQTVNPPIGGVPMDRARTIAANAAAAPTLSTLLTLVRTAGAEAVLAGPGPVTVFAPSNDAFTRLAPGTVDTLSKPENKATLTRVLSYHVVPGAVTLQQLQSQIQAGGGKATLTTVEGGTLTAALEGQALSLTDANNNKAYVAIADVGNSNGVIHVVNGVLSPKLN